MRRRARKNGPLRRLIACGKVRRIARRAGRLDERDQLGELTLGALQTARRAAREIEAVAEDIDEATMEGILQGRTLVREEVSK